MANDLRGPLPVKVDPTSMASFARCHWPSPWRALTPKPNGGSAPTPNASGLNGGPSCNRCAVRRPPSSR
jgi:hypothetical protein